MKVKFEYRITLAYLVFGTLWILFSDRILNNLIIDEIQRANFQMYKGWLYVLITAIFLFFLVRKHLKNLREAESILEQKNKALSKAHNKAKESSRLKTAFLNNISHELRTPMNGILGFTELLTRQDINDDKKVLYSNLIKDSSEKLLCVVTDIIELSQIQQKQITLNLHVCNPYEMLNIIIAPYKQKIHDKSLELKLEFDHIIQNIRIETDCYKIQRSINHILDNAIKFTQKGNISIKTRTSDSEVLITISDTGIGIPDEIMSKIFDPFRQVETEDSKRFGGNGVGLSLARSYIEMLGGKLWIESLINSGTTVHISLPRTNKEIEATSLKEKKQKNDLTGMQILIVEDEEINYLYLKELLTNAGAHIEHAENGKIAIELCKQNENLDLILMDIKMPVMDGIEATKQIRKFNSKLPIIAQSAYDPLIVHQTNSHEMFTAFIAKPIRENDLFDLIYIHI